MGCALHQKEEQYWIAMPPRPRLDGEGRPQRDDKSRLLYTPAIEFRNATVKRLFDRQVLKIVLMKKETAE
jgi:hypothetical protein